ncbi:MAG: MbtH family protein [Gordonia sp.]|uniref:MbtH family protein n=1 Tax=Gordonia rubripertincta TaxID=36822 RepID=A0ABT4N2A9_GORRU|nr:MbtH family protein [Gordonia rubripertincta]MBA4022190.1 MbtH family protein [Gordonia sp. (in: high G+C Gram-positive bacteria)]MCZ4553403.1 MbtH family protein [Gordonia rubripertincta]
MMNPFDDERGTFRVLVNHEGQHSLWPDFAPVPGGWTSQHGPSGREDCLQYVEDNWRDIAPMSLKQSMSERKHGARAVRDDKWWING